jgi:hypothetical protein
MCYATLPQDKQSKFDLDAQLQVRVRRVLVQTKEHACANSHALALVITVTGGCPGHRIDPSLVARAAGAWTLRRLPMLSGNCLALIATPDSSIAFA